MPDARQLVDRIRVFLNAQGNAVAADVVALATDYAELCREANSRLRRCMEFLRDGLRGEAIESAQTRPPLLEQLVSLDFREILEWERVCAVRGLPRPGRISLDAARELQDAVKKQAPLHDLLAKYRYLALARSGPRERLAVLRQLIAADPSTPCWRRDVDELERSRMLAIRSEAAAALHANDVEAIEKLLAEVQSGDWMTPIPADVLEQLNRTATAVYQASAINRLRTLLPRVRSAYAALAYDQCRQVFAEWGKIVKDAKVNVPPELREEILPLAHWLDEQEEMLDRKREFRVACAELMDAIKTGADTTQLAPFYKRAMLYELDLPAEVASAYRGVVQAERDEIRAEKNKQFAIAAALVGSIIAALGALAYVVMHTTGK